MSVTTSVEDLDFYLTTDMSVVDDAWDLLCATNEHSLHQSRSWCIAWAKAHQQELIFLVGKQRDKIALLMPLVHHKRMGVRYLGSPANAFSNINTVLCDPSVTPVDDLPSANRLKSKLSKAIAPHADALIISKLPLQWRGCDCAFSGLQSVQNQNSAFQLPLLEDFETTLKQINAKRRRKKFRISVQAAELFGGYTYKIAQTAAEQHEILDVFFKQKAIRLDGLGLPNPFASQSVQQFFHKLADFHSHIENEKALELHYIELNGCHDEKVISVAGLSRKGDHVICQFGSITEGPASAISPGELLFHHIIEHEHGLGTRLFDFGIGDQRYKRSWCPVETAQYDFHIAASQKGRLLCGFLTGSVKAKQFVKAHPALYRFIQRLRNSKAANTEE